MKLDDLIGTNQEDPTRPLVVMCWERLDGPNAHAHCHRTVLVELLEERALERGLAVVGYSRNTQRLLEALDQALKGEGREMTLAELRKEVGLEDDEDDES